jgi:hypothetical protein
VFTDRLPHHLVEVVLDGALGMVALPAHVALLSLVVADSLHRRSDKTAGRPD